MKITPISRIDQVRDAILTQIALGNLPPGERLYEAKLSKELGVSQATVNAALQDLHNQGLVTKVLNRSTNVNRFTLDDVRKLFQVRLALEPAAAEAVAARWSSEIERVLLDRLETMRRAARGPDIGNWCLSDYRFHQEIFRLSGNPFLIQAGQAIAAVPFFYILCDSLHRLPSDDYRMMTEEHRELIEAIGQGPDAAGRLTRELVLKWLAWLVDSGGTHPSGVRSSTASRV